MAQAPKKKPTSALDMLKSWVSPGSAAGKVRDSDSKTKKALRDAGVAKAGRTSAKPKAKTRLA